MKLTIAKEQMIYGLQTVQNVVSARSTLPILSNVLFRAEGSILRMTATDLDVSISCGVEANIVRAGVSTVPVKRLYGIVRELGEGEIEVEVDDRNVTSIRSGSSVYKINGLGAEEFPQLPEFKGERKVVVDQATFKEMLRKTSYAISSDETRYVLNGIFVSVGENKLTMVATDGRRLALVEQEVDGTAKKKGEFILPAKAVSELNRLLLDKGKVEILWMENHTAFTLLGEKSPTVLLVSKLIDGNYPNYRQVIPSEAKERIALLREELLHALRRAEFMTSEKSNSVRLTFSKNNLAITANSPEVGEGRESLAINYKGKEFAIAFNPRYLIEPLSALTTDEVFFELTDELSPGVIKINAPFLYVVMPMRLT